MIICLCYNCVIVFSHLIFCCKFISIIYVFVIIKKGEIVRTRIVLINILSFDDNNVYEFCLRQCGTLILCNFHFKKYIKSMHKISARSTDSEGSSMQHQNMLSQDIRRWSSKIRTWSMKNQKNLSSEVEALKFLWYHPRSTSKSEDKKMLCTKLNDSNIQTLYLQRSYQ